MAAGGGQSVRIELRDVVIRSRAARPGRLPQVGPVAPHHPLYPYRMFRDLDFAGPEAGLAPRTFHAIVIENESLELTVLPELGGRLHRALHKPSGYDLFYHNDAIRAQLVGLRGAWYAGGVEFNFPDSHSLTTHSPIEYAVGRGPDGSAEAIIANTCRATRMRWQVRIGLSPGRDAIRFATRLFNRTAFPQRYYYWLNAAVPQGPQIRYHFAATQLIGHVQEVDGVATRLDSFPMLRGGGDARRPAELPDTTSIFMLDNHSGFFGYYDTAADIGLARSAPVRNVPGNKIWSWGDTDYGRRFNRRLLPPGAQFYGELQSGRPESQVDWALIEPFELIEAEEWWYPLPGLGGLTAGSAELCAFIDPQGERVRLAANRAFDALAVSVFDARTSRPLAEQRFNSVRPSVPLELRLAAMPQACGAAVLCVLVRDGSGRVVLDHRPPAAECPRSIILDLYEHKATAERSAAASAGQLAVRAVAAIRASELPRAERLCRKAIDLDGACGPARRWLGWLLRRQGHGQQAAEQFAAALLADPMDYAAFYQYAATLAERASALALIGADGAAGAADRAAVELERAVGYCHGQYRAWAAVLLVRLLRLAGRVEQADAVAAEWSAVVAFGPLGRLAGAAASANPWCDDPTDLVAAIVAGGRVEDALVAWWSANLKPADDAADAGIEAACELLEAGDRDRGRAVLRWLTEHPTLGPSCPTAHYRLGAIDGDLAGGVARAAHCTDRSAMCWPGRADDLDLLAAACRAAPGDALAHALLGLRLLSLGRAEESLAPLARATELDDSDAMAWRNLGLARWSAGRPWAECLQAYERARAIWPDYVPLIVETDSMLAARGAPVVVRRRLLYEQLPTAAGEHAAVAHARAALALADSDYAAGLAELTARPFHPGEGGFGTRHLFERLHLRLGERAARQGNWSAAAEHFRHAMEYPENLGIGRPGRAREGRPRFLLAMALERLGRPAEAREQVEHVVAHARRGDPAEAYFAILAARKLGRPEQADQWLAALAERVAERSKDAADGDSHWTRWSAAMLARARGDRVESNRILAELGGGPAHEPADFLASELY